MSPKKEEDTLVGFSAYQKARQKEALTPRKKEDGSRRVTFTNEEETQNEAQDALKATLYRQKRAWDLALSAGKSIPMNAFMMWMAGNAVQIFSIAITAMMFFQGLKGLFSTSKAFRPLEEEDEVTGTTQRHWLPMCVYALFQLMLVALGLYKCSAMGLLPNDPLVWKEMIWPSAATASYRFVPHPDNQHYFAS